MFVGVDPTFSASFRQIFQPKPHQCPLKNKTTHQSKHTHLHFCLPSPQLSSVPNNRLFAYQFILQYGPQISEKQFLNAWPQTTACVYLRNSFFFAILGCVMFRVTRRIFWTFYGPYSWNKYPHRNSRRLVVRLHCGEKLRVVDFPRVIKGAQAFIYWRHRHIIAINWSN